MPPPFNGLLWLVACLFPLLLIQWRLQRNIQAIFLLLTRRVEIALALFALLLFPGVLLHEASHYGMARLLGVATGRFSLLPQVQAGRLQLGFVETAETDWLRDAFIGLAPLLTGGVFVAYAGLQPLGLTELWSQFLIGDPAVFSQAFTRWYSRPDFWLWFYLTFAVSSTMLPSASDRRAWLPLGLILVLLFGLSWWMGMGSWMLENLAPAFDQALLVVAMVFGISLFIQLLLLIPGWFLQLLISRILGLEVR